MFIMPSSLIYLETLPSPSVDLYLTWNLNHAFVASLTIAVYIIRRQKSRKFCVPGSYMCNSISFSAGYVNRCVLVQVRLQLFLFPSGENQQTNKKKFLTRCSYQSIDDCRFCPSRNLQLFVIGCGHKVCKNSACILLAMKLDGTLLAQNNSCPIHAEPTQKK